MRPYVLMAMTTALLTAPPATLAGAPNYDCIAARHARLSVDQWAGVIAATGFEPGPTVWGVARDVRQNGPSLDLTARIRGASWSVSVRGMGTALRIDTADGTERGRCAFVPGNFVLRAADDGGAALRTGPSPSARRLLTVRAGTAVWQIPGRAPRGRWLPVRAFVPRDGATRALDGWLRQRGPLAPR